MKGMGVRTNFESDINALGKGKLVDGLQSNSYR